MEATDIFSFFDINLLIKIGLAIAGLLYTFFAFLIVRQSTLMEHVLENEENALVRLLAYTHFFAALGLTILTFIS